MLVFIIFTILLVAVFSPRSSSQTIVYQSFPSILTYILSGTTSITLSGLTYTNPLVNMLFGFNGTDVGASVSYILPTSGVATATANYVCLNIGLSNSTFLYPFMRESSPGLYLYVSTPSGPVAVPVVVAEGAVTPGFYVFCFQVEGVNGTALAWLLNEVHNYTVYNFEFYAFVVTPVVVVNGTVYQLGASWSIDGRVVRVVYSGDIGVDYTGPGRLVVKSCWGSICAVLVDRVVTVYHGRVYYEVRVELR